MSNNQPHVLALDLGGTSLRAAFAPIEYPTALESIGRWPAPDSAAALRDKVIEIIAAHTASGPLAGIGITIPGLVEGTVSRWVPNLPYLDGIDLAGLLRPAGAPVAAGNDAQIALLAEATVGAAQGLDDAILLAIGTGIGSSVLAGGRIVRGAHGGACSFGWAVADVTDRGGDRSGWLERQAAGRALDARAEAVGLANGAALIDAARSGDATARAAIDAAGTALGTALAGAVALLDPQAILLAGGVSETIDVLGPPLLESLRRHVPPHLRTISIRPGLFGPRAGLVGAAVAAGHGPQWWRIR
ncbi:ROK family protein [Kaistia dalseonensis]|uniref:Glucokinase n=1 Tax=Kaistia dalseonensis TaxID=410840 RepID=A0ABU0H6W1_9HYPH|nr:ROK family protein [Kaistia dalseonensis]MCX5494621.1 ROK family protein [Kaistia dalseonensis]MDQ0437201.1 glucokinase [Kaistia dalseonensis]